MAARNQRSIPGVQGQTARQRSTQWPGGRAAVSGSTSTRRKPRRLGVSVADIDTTLSVAWGGRCIDDFIDRGRVKHVIVQADAPFRMVPEDFNHWYLRNNQGQMVSMSIVALRVIGITVRRGWSVLTASQL